MMRCKITVSSNEAARGGSPCGRGAYGDTNSRPAGSCVLHWEEGTIHGALEAALGAKHALAHDR
jgi:hypothetical protein